MMNVGPFQLDNDLSSDEKSFWTILTISQIKNLIMTAGVIQLDNYLSFDEKSFWTIVTFIVRLSA